jgi:hypothetical protein
MDDNSRQNPHTVAAERARRAVAALRAPGSRVSVVLAEAESEIQELFAQLHSLEHARAHGGPPAPISQGPDSEERR